MGLLLTVRLVHVQLVQGADFKIQADDNRFYTVRIPAERGVFLDRYGQPLVWNSHTYYRITDPGKLYSNQERITREEALRLMATESGQVATSMERLYRYPEALSQVLGFVGPVTAEELARGAATSLRDQVGKLGLELTQNTNLRGTDGKEIFEINAVGQRQKLVSREAAIAGSNLQTTLDPYLSQVAYQALSGKKGVVIILDAQTGDVLSLVSSPSYNANYLSGPAEDQATEQERQRQISALFTDERKLFFNRAVDGMYPPGSVFKLVTALAGLEEQKIDASTEVVDEGTLKVGEYEYGNWYYRQYGRTEGPLSLVRAIARSNDIYFYKAAEAIGPTNLAVMARLFGFGDVTTIQLRPQAKGLVPDPAWKEQTLGERWFLGNTYHYGIGQGDLLVSPIQIAQLLQALGHQGTLCPPTLLDKSPSKCIELGIKQEHLDLVLEGMLDACSTGGTAFPFFSYNETHRTAGATPETDLSNGAVACKTGTAEFGAADANDHRRTHGWFVALSEFHLENSVAATPSAIVVTPASEVATSAAEVNRNDWVQQIQAKGFPDRLVFVALVESDDDLPFAEGSREAGPVIKQVIDWMNGT